MNYTWNRMWSSFAPLVCLATSPETWAPDWPLSWNEKRPRCWEAGLRLAPSLGREVPGQAPWFLQGDHASQPNAFKAWNSPQPLFYSHSHIWDHLMHALYISWANIPIPGLQFSRENHKCNVYGAWGGGKTLRVNCDSSMIHCVKQHHCFL